MTRTRLDWIALNASYALFVVWFFWRELLQRPKNRIIEYMCWFLALIGCAGVVALFRDTHSDLYCFLFPLLLFYVHRWSLSLFMRRFHHAPRDTWWRVGPPEDYLYNFLFALFAILAPVLTAIQIDRHFNQ